MGWSHHKPIAVSAANVDANLTDFPLLVDVSADGDLSKARADGYDIRFTLDDGTTQLKYERLAWSGGGGSAAWGKWWVKLPSINLSTGASIQMHYGNPAAGDGQDAAGTFAASGLVAALHLNEASGPFADATGNGHDGTNVGTVQAAGIIDNGRQTTAASDRITIADHADLDGMDNLTVETWSYLNGFAFSPTICTLISKPDNTGPFAVRVASSGTSLKWLANGSQNTYGAIGVGAWHHTMGCYERNAAAGFVSFVDGVIDPSPAAAPDAPINSNAFDLALLNRPGGSYAFDGIIEGFRLWRTANPCGNRAAYAKFVHANVTAGDNELTIGAEVSNGSPSFFRRYIMGV